MYKVICDEYSQESYEVESFDEFLEKVYNDFGVLEADEAQARGYWDLRGNYRDIETGNYILAVVDEEN